MLDILLVIHIVISILLIIVILLQKNNSDGLAGLGGSSGSNMGLVTARSAANFFTRITIFLAVLFMGNALLLANLSNRNHKEEDLTNKLQESESTQNNKTLPLAK